MIRIDGRVGRVGLVGMLVMMAGAAWGQGVRTDRVAFDRGEAEAATGHAAESVELYWYDGDIYFKDGTATTGQKLAGLSTVTDHGALTGLADDDHSQYYNTARLAAYLANATNGNAVAISGDRDSNTTLGAHVADADIHLKLADIPTAAGADPTGAVNGTAAAGSATTYLRSDGAPALANPFTVSGEPQVWLGSMAVEGAADTDPAALYFYADLATDDSDKWRLQAADGGAVTLETFAGGSYVKVLQADNSGLVTIPDTDGLWVGETANGGKIYNDAAGPIWEAASGKDPLVVGDDVSVKLGDASAAKKLKVLDSSGATVGSWNSDGVIDAGSYNAGAVTSSGAISGTDGTFTGDLNLNGGTDSNYKIGDRSHAMYAQNQNSARNAIFELYAKDGDTTDQVQFNAWGRGTPSSVSNRERMLQGWDPTLSAYICATEAAGTGTVRPLILYTGANRGQLTLATDGSVIAKGIEAGAATLALWGDEGDDNNDKYQWTTSDGATTYAKFQSYASGSWVDRIVVSSTGYVGINDTTPDSDFSVGMNWAGAGLFYVIDDGDTARIVNNGTIRATDGFVYGTSDSGITGTATWTDFYGATCTLTIKGGIITGSSGVGL